MLAKTITYTDYNDVERTETFYFNISKAELLEMEYGTTGGLSQAIDKLLSAIDLPEIIKIFKDIVLKAYGEKSADGRRFIKSEELSTAFSQTEAYTAIFMELATDADAAAAFINGVMPRLSEDQESKIKAAIEAKNLTSKSIEFPATRTTLL